MTELAARFARPRAAAIASRLYAALPLVTILALTWLYLERQPQTKIGNHAWYTFWYVLPTLPMFLIFPALLSRFGFWITLAYALVAPRLKASHAE